MKKAQVIWSVFVIVVTAAIVCLVWAHLRTYLQNDHQVVLARTAQWRLHELAIEMESAEIGARGYMLTSRQRFLDNYRRSKAQMDMRLAEAQRAVPGVALESELAKISELVRQRLGMLDEMVALAAQGKRDQAVDMLESDPVLSNGDDLRNRGFELMKRTDDQLIDRLGICRESTMRMTRWVLIGVGALVLSSLALVWMLWRDLLCQQRIAAELAIARDAALAGTKARDEFLNVLSHELRTPLTPALACIGLLERKADRASEMHADLTMIRRQLELEARLIDDLLNVEQTLRGKMVLRLRDVSMHDLIKQAIDSCQDQIVHGNLTLSRKLEATQDIVRGDESRLYLLIWHLLSNAVKFTPTGGSVSVSTSSSNHAVEIIVSDTGIGMTGEQLAKIFQPFRQIDSSLTRRFGGLGLGLAIGKHVAELHGGSIRAASAGSEKGATFTLTLPLISTHGDEESLQRRAQPLSELR
jgi:signal transduction histidine kinase